MCVRYTCRIHRCLWLWISLYECRWIKKTKYYTHLLHRYVIIYSFFFKFVPNWVFWYGDDASRQGCVPPRFWGQNRCWCSRACEWNALQLFQVQVYLLKVGPPSPNWTYGNIKTSGMFMYSMSPCGSFIFAQKCENFDCWHSAIIFNRSLIGHTVEIKQQPNGTRQIFQCNNSFVWYLWFMCSSFIIIIMHIRAHIRNVVPNWFHSIYL